MQRRFVFVARLAISFGTNVNIHYMINDGYNLSPARRIRSVIIWFIMHVASKLLVNHFVVHNKLDIAKPYTCNNT